MTVSSRVVCGQLLATVRAFSSEAEVLVRTSLLCSLVALSLTTSACKRSNKLDIPVSASSTEDSQNQSSDGDATGTVPIIGGTLFVTRDGMAVVSDPDRDRVVFVDLDSMHADDPIALSAGAFPGRATEDEKGNVYVVLRGESRILKLSGSGEVLSKFNTCENPRGIVARDATEEIIVACADGEVLAYSRAGKLRGGAEVGVDLRDVVLTADGSLYVTQFREAKILRLNDAFEIEGELTAPGSTDALGGALEPRVLWDLVEAPNGRLVGLHQHAASRELTPPAATPGSPSNSTPTYYGAAGMPVVESAITAYGETAAEESSPVMFEVLAVDADVDPATGEILLVSPGSHSYSVGDVFSRAPYRVETQPIAGALHEGRVLLQTREPSEIIVVEDGVIVDRAWLGGADVTSMGHAIFHATPEGPASAITCASCHPEGRDDAHTWNFADIGLRRTQTLLGGVMQGAPFHWSGDIDDLDHLMNEVFTVRMGNRELTKNEVKGFASWLDDMPELNRTSKKVAGGEAAFEEAGCSACHSGARFTNEKNKDVGTGEALQTPSLLGVKHRAPYMHDGCAETLVERFDEACGGKDHGDFDTLSESEQAKLLEYLGTL